MVQQPEPAQGVLNHVAHDPVGGEELGDGWDVFLGDCPFGCHNRILSRRYRTGITINHFHILTVSAVRGLPDGLQHGLGREQVLRHEQFGIIFDFGEEEVHLVGVAVADGDSRSR